MVTKTRNADRTRRAILDAAVAEFGAVGPAGARIDAIAAAASVNKRMLYHYFASKEGLFAAVLEDQLAAKPVDAPSLVARYVNASGRRDWIRLLMWEALGGDRRRVDTERAGVLQTVERVRESGRYVADFDAAHLELAFTAIALFPLAFPQLTRLISGAAPTDPQFAASWSAFLTAFEARVALKPEPTEAKPRFRRAASVTESPPRARED